MPAQWELTFAYKCRLRTDGQTDGETEAITISPSLFFKKSVGITTTQYIYTLIWKWACPADKGKQAHSAKMG